MSRRALGLGLLLCLCACRERRKDAPSPDFAGARARAEAAHSGPASREPLKPAPAPAADAVASAPAPEAEPPKAKLLSKDPRGCSWLQSEGLVTVGENDSRHQARASAVAEARKAAMQDFLGVEVKSRFMDFQQEGLREQKGLTESILRTTRLGRIVDEKVDSEGFADVPGCPGCRYRVVLRSCLTPISPSADRDFQVELGLSRSRFVQGDEARVSVTPSKDAFVYLYNVGMNWETALIAPNEAVPEIKLKAGQTWEYPDEQARRRGVKLVAELPQGQTVSAETVRVLASRTPLPKRLLQTGAFLELLRALNLSDIEWADDAQAFTIYDR